LWSFRPSAFSARLPWHQIAQERVARQARNVVYAQCFLAAVQEQRLCLGVIFPKAPQAPEIGALESGRVFHFDSPEATLAVDHETPVAMLLYQTVDHREQLRRLLDIVDDEDLTIRLLVDQFPQPLRTGKVFPEPVGLQHVNQHCLWGLLPAPGRFARSARPEEKVRVQVSPYWLSPAFKRLF